MNKGKYLLRRACLLAVSIIFTYSTGIQGAEQISEASSGARADVIQIDSMTTFGKLEKPPVEFLHDAHTETLSQKNKNCAACHRIDNGGMSLKFKRIKDTARIEVMNVYHKECISCHGEMKVEGEKTGPVECDDCHAEKAEHSSSRQPMGFDKSLHFRHSEAQDKKCERCHHEYDENTKKLFYAKGKEGTCRYCHKAETQDNVISMRLASHLACIDCHRKNQEKKKETGPVTCSGCHEASAQGKIKKMASVPRMEGKQPDSVMLKGDQNDAEADSAKLNRMNWVPFDHKAHEIYSDTCRVCHHESLKPCNDCHSLAGKKEGNDINLEKAMHLTDTEKSCQGCHLIQQDGQNCAGCHGFIGKGEKKEEESCNQCHLKPVLEQGMPFDAEQEKALTAQMLQSRNPVTGTYSQEDIPETVVIKNLSKQYEAVDFPHRRIVNALVNNIKDNKLAAYFHPREGTVCQGCHHNSPVSKKPPYCANCHGKPFDAESSLKPGILGAYHLQCMGCHKEMGMTKPMGCNDCHKKMR
jgi:hypothetical protein